MYYRELHNLRRGWFATINATVIPLLYLFLFGLSIGKLMGDIEYGGQPISYFLFLAPGVVGISIIFSAVNSGGMLSNDRYWGILERLLSWPISRTSYILARILVAITISTILLLLVLLVGIPLIEGELHCANPFLILLSTLLGVICFCSLITPFALFIKSMSEFYGLTGIMLLPIILCSSAFYPLEAMPSWLRTIAYINPMTYMVDVLRAGFHPIMEPAIPLEIEILILCVFTSFFFVISIISLRRVRI
jgi:ABC-2 type transport system permease protein